MKSILRQNTRSLFQVEFDSHEYELKKRGLLKLDALIISIQDIIMKWE